MQKENESAGRKLMRRKASSQKVMTDNRKASINDRGGANGNLILWSFIYHFTALPIDPPSFRCTYQARISSKVIVSAQKLLSQRRYDPGWVSEKETKKQTKKNKQKTILRQNKNKIANEFSNFMEDFAQSSVNAWLHLDHGLTVGWVWALFVLRFEKANVTDWTEPKWNEDYI